MHDLVPISLQTIDSAVPHLDRMRINLARIFRIEELLEYEHKAEALERLARKLKDQALFRDAVEFRWEARRNLGRVIREMQERGELAGRGKRKCHPGRTFRTLDEYGITRNQSSDYQWVYDLSKQDYRRQVEHALANVQRAEGMVFRQRERERRAARFYFQQH